MSHQTSLESLRQAAVGRLAPALPLLSELGERFGSAGYELALVGGPVRDAFLGRSSLDFDLTTSARPQQIEKAIEGWADATWDIGRVFGTIGARKGNHIIEITTFRADSYDRITRKPEVSFGDNLDDDLYRRDFTVNAMALVLPDLRFVDPYGGLADLADRRLRTPSPPEVSFGDDPLRMMRAARFVAQLGFEIDQAAREAMAGMAGSLAMVSAERIRDELVRLILAPAPRGGLSVMVESGLADVVLPELPALQLEVDEHHRHKDVYEHSLTVLDQAIALESRLEDEDLQQGVGDEEGPDVPRPDLVLRLAALLHDIGKPATRRFEPGGGVTFHHHEVVGAKLAARRLKALRFDKETTKAVARLIELHLRFHGYSDGDWTDSAVRRYVADAGPLLARLHVLTRADCTTRNVRKAQRLAVAYDSLEQRIGRLLAQEELRAVRPELDGHRIGSLLGIPPGPVLGRAYKHLLQVRLDRGPIGVQASEAELLSWWADQPESGQSSLDGTKTAAADES